MSPGSHLLASWRQRYSFVKVISARLDSEFFKMIARRVKTADAAASAGSAQ